jgi:hypothetical protein
LTCQFEGTSSVDPDGTIVAYSWDFGDGAMSTASEPVHTYSAAGTYTVTLTVTDNEGLTGTAQTQVQVSAPIAGDITLMVEAFKVQGVQHARLLWSGTSASMIDIYRDSNFLIQVANTGGVAAVHTPITCVRLGPRCVPNQRLPLSNKAPQPDYESR